MVRIVILLNLSHCFYFLTKNVSYYINVEPTLHVLCCLIDIYDGVTVCHLRGYLICGHIQHYLYITKKININVIVSYSLVADPESLASYTINIKSRHVYSIS